MRQGALKRPLCLLANGPLLDLRLLLQVLGKSLSLFILNRFGDLSLDLVECRELRLTHIFQHDHVVPELRLHR